MYKTLLLCVVLQRHMHTNTIIIFRFLRFHLRDLLFFFKAERGPKD